MKLEPGEFYHFAFKDAAGHYVTGSYEQPSRAFAFARTHQLTTHVIVNQRLVEVTPDEKAG